MPTTSSTTGSTAQSIASLISGQVAGFDVPGAVDGLLGVKKFEISQLQKKQTAITARQDAYNKINSALVTLRDVSRNMSDSASFFDYSASLSSNSSTVPASSLLDVSGTSGLAAGQHSIVVSQIAQAERLSSSAAVKDASTGVPVNSATTALNMSGSFTLAGATVTVQLGDSLNDIAANINQLNVGTGGTGVTASVMKVGSNDYRLVLASDTTGSTGFSLTSSGTGTSPAPLDVGGALAGLQLGASGQTNAAQTLQAAQDASISIDGLVMTRSSNTISDALSGVTLSLKQADPNVSVNVSIGVDQTALRNKVQSFVDAYNSVQTLIADQFKFDPNTGVGGVLSGDALLSSIQASMANGLIQSVPGLAADRNSLVMLGIEPDSKGKLTINPALFDNFVANDPNAIRDLFVEKGSSSNSQLQFLYNGLNAPSGTYSVNITQAATKATLTGATDLTTGLAADESITVTSGASTATVALKAGQTQSQIITALNAELSKDYTEQRQFSTALTIPSTPATPASGSTTFDALGLGVAANDTITIGGKLRSGVVVSGTYTVLDPKLDTISGLLTAIQTTFNNEVLASIDANGKITVTDTAAGDSQLTVSLTAHNQGLGTLDFGADASVINGRYALPVQAVISGNGVALEANAFGSGGSFSVTQSADGLGFGALTSSATGLDVIGTINGLAATGSGQGLTGSAGSVDGLSLFYTGTAIGAIGDITLGRGIGSVMDGTMDMFGNPVTGLVFNAMQSEQTKYDDIKKRIADLNAQMEQQRVTLTKQFTSMQKALSLLQNSSSFLTQQINAQNAQRP